MSFNPANINTAPKIEYNVRALVLRPVTRPPSIDIRIAAESQDTFFIWVDWIDGPLEFFLQEDFNGLIATFSWITGSTNDGN